MAAIALAAGIPLIPALIGTAFGIKKDGSPLRRSWWTATPTTEV